LEIDSIAVLEVN